MQPEEEQLRKLSGRYFRLAIVSLFLMAFLRGLSPFFFSIFFWPALGLGIIGFYYQRAARKEEEAKTAQWRQPGYGAPSSSNSKRTTLIVIVSAISLMVIVSSLISSMKGSNTSSTETNQTVKPEQKEENQESSNEEKQELSTYDKAQQEYNNQNYRSAISIARNGLLESPNNNDLMLLLGDSYGFLKQNDSSFIWFDRVYQNGVRSGYLSHWLGYLYDEKGNLSEGIRFYKDALKQDSSRSQIYDRLAELEPNKAAWY